MAHTEQNTNSRLWPNGVRPGAEVTEYRFTVPGVPAPGGSKRAFIITLEAW